MKRTAMIALAASALASPAWSSTVINHVNGIQAGRLEKAAWNAPEVELSKILNGGGGAKGK